MSKKVTEGEASWAAIIRAVRTPLGFFALAGLLLEGLLVPLAASASGWLRTGVTIAAVLFPFSLVVLVAGLAIWRPEALHGRRPQPPRGLREPPRDAPVPALPPLQAPIAKERPPSRPLELGASVPPDPVRIKVSTAEEFLAAIGSNRIIELASGVLDLGAARDRYLEHVRWNREHDGLSLTIRRVERLTITGAADGSSRLVVEPAYTYVLAFEDCRAIELRGLTLGHAPPGGCTGGVISAARCEYLEISNCRLFGCGTEGLTLQDVRSFRMAASEIFECTYGIATISACRDLDFRQCRFHHNEQFYGFVIRDCEYIEFTDSTVESNRCDAPLFEVTSSWPVRFRRGAIRWNHTTSVGDGVSIEDAEVHHNGPP